MKEIILVQKVKLRVRIIIFALSLFITSQLPYISRFNNSYSSFIVSVLAPFILFGLVQVFFHSIGLIISEQMIVLKKENKIEKYELKLISKIIKNRLGYKIILNNNTYINVYSIQKFHDLESFFKLVFKNEIALDLSDLDIQSLLNKLIENSRR